MDVFGNTDPKRMPLHLFRNAVEIDYSSAIRGNIEQQDYSVCPRHWYISARLRCESCNSEYLWSAEEQKVWFEVYNFYVQSYPVHCPKCRSERRNAIELQQEYDGLVSYARSGGTVEQKERIVAIVDELKNYLGALPQKMYDTRDLFLKQIEKHQST